MPERVHEGSKDPGKAAGAPYPPAREHHDGPPDRPAHSVPTAPGDEREEGLSEETVTEREEDGDGP